MAGVLVLVGGLIDHRGLGGAELEPIARLDLIAAGTATTAVVPPLINRIGMTAESCSLCGRHK